MDGKFVCRIYGVDDNPKENRLFGHTIPSELASSLWLAPVYPERDTIREAVAAALTLYNQVHKEQWDRIERGKSLASGFNDADPQAILAWNKRMAELVAMNDIQQRIDDLRPAREGRLASPLTKIQKEWMEYHLSQADCSTASV